jgi:hypothetical protein
MVLNKVKNFNIEIENIILESQTDYIDAVIMWCEKNNIEVEYAAELIKKDMVLFSKIKSNAEDLNILKRSAQLPL